MEPDSFQEVVVDHAPLLHALGLDEAAFLGAGAEARVYALDEDRVVRIVDPRTSEDYLRRLEHFYAGLGRAGVSFALPEVLELGAHETGVRYTIERRIPGRDMMRVLDALEGNPRERALVGYIEAALALRRVQVSAPTYHLPIASPGQMFGGIASMLEARVRRAGDRRDAETRESLPAWDEAFKLWCAVLSELEDVPPALVHGDYFPANVMATPEGEVTGVVDFSNLTMFGDPRLDLVSALSFLRELKTWTQRDSDIALAAIPASERLPQVMDLYRGFYALYFTPFAFHDDPSLLVWCRQILGQMLEV